MRERTIRPLLETLFDVRCCRVECIHDLVAQFEFLRSAGRSKIAVISTDTPVTFRYTGNSSIVLAIAVSTGTRRTDADTGFEIRD